MKENFSFLSSEGTCQINSCIWTCDNPKMILQISHGMAETAQNYEELALFLNKHNIIVCANDHLGHGDSVISEERISELFDKDGYNYVVEDIKKLHDIVADKYPGLPYAILGFSLGSFLFRRFLQIYGKEIDGAIIMGTGKKAQATIATSKVFQRLYNKLKNKQAKNFIVKKANNLVSKKYWKINNKTFNWFQIEKQDFQKYVESDIGKYVYTVHTFYNIVALYDVIQKKSNIKKMPKNIPICFLSGKDDMVGNFGKTVKALYKKYKKIGIKHISMKLYPGMKHVILKSECKDEVMSDILSFLKNKIL